MQEKKSQTFQDGEGYYLYVWNWDGHICLGILFVAMYFSKQVT